MIKTLNDHPSFYLKDIKKAEKVKLNREEIRSDMN